MTQVISENGFCDDIWQGVLAPELADFAEGDAAVALNPGDDVATLIPHFATLKLVIVRFPSSADGRGFSQSAQLRALGFGGHIRARGHVLVDQLRAAKRSGITDIEISADQAQRNPSHQWQAVHFKNSYQSHVFAR